MATNQQNRRIPKNAAESTASVMMKHLLNKEYLIHVRRDVITSNAAINMQIIST